MGRFETKARLIVLDTKPKLEPPQFTQPLVDKTIADKSTVIFEATVSGLPSPTLTWFWNGQPIIKGANSNAVIREFDGSSKLELHNVSIDQAGDIVCKAGMCVFPYLIWIYRVSQNGAYGKICTFTITDYLKN